VFTVEVRPDPDDDLMRSLAGLRNFRPDFSGDHRAIVEAVQREHKRARLAGLDRDGKELIPVKQPNDPRRGGAGPALTPKGSRSRAHNNLIVDTDPGRSGIRITAGYIGMPFLEYHARGTVRGAPVRNILGLQPEAEEAIDRIVLDSLDEQVRAASSFFGRTRRFFGL
jgi:hypothetical protein